MNREITDQDKKLPIRTRVQKDKRKKETNEFFCSDIISLIILIILTQKNFLFLFFFCSYVPLSCR